MRGAVREYSLAELAHLCGAELHGDGSIIISGVAPLSSAERSHIAFLDNRKYLPSSLYLIKAGAVVTHPSFADDLQGIPLLLSPKPKATFARIAQLLHGIGPTTSLAGIHPLSWLDEEVTVGSGVSIGPFTCIGSGSNIGDGTLIMAQCYVGREVLIGSDCILYPGVIILDRCRIGNRVIIHSGTVIGSDGFGYAQDESGEHIKIPQLGTVVIEDDVEIGANCTIDRATFGETRIQRGTKIDNLVTIAHNVRIGEKCILAGQTGVAGSSTIGDGVIIAGQVGIADHVTIGDGVRIGAKSGVALDVKANVDIVGIPAVPKEEQFRLYRNMRSYDRLKKKVEELDKLVKRFVAKQDQGDDKRD
jgi:UDP-3-O-[3-hydroxymyristoyl] glucosamine N-acyltransferase